MTAPRRLHRTLTPPVWSAPTDTGRDVLHSSLFGIWWCLPCLLTPAAKRQNYFLYTWNLLYGAPTPHRKCCKSAIIQRCYLGRWLVDQSADGKDLVYQSGCFMGHEIYCLLQEDNIGLYSIEGTLSWNFLERVCYDLSVLNVTAVYKHVGMSLSYLRVMTPVLVIDKKNW